MGSNGKQCFSDLLHEVPKWLEDFEMLIQSIETWRLRHHDGLDAQQIEHPRASSSTGSRRLADCNSMYRRRTGIWRSAALRLPQEHALAPSRKMAVIYYDATIQKQLEALVRSIYNGQRYLRKGNMTIRHTSRLSTSRLGSSGGRLHGGRNHHGMLAPTFNPGTGVRLDQPGRILSDAGDGPTKALTEIELALLDSQTLCEHAAHQILRDGDCGGDLEIVKSHFHGILRICVQETGTEYGGERSTGEQRFPVEQRLARSSLGATSVHPWSTDTGLYCLEADEGDREEDDLEDR